MDIILNIEYINIQLHGYNPKYRVYEYTDTYKYIVLIHGYNPKHRVKDNIYIDTQAQECKARKVNCGCVYSVYILKPVLFGRNL